MPPARSVLFGFDSEPFAFSLLAEEGRIYRLESSHDMINWYTTKSLRVQARG